MMDKVIFGRYVPMESLLHRMDPRSKLLIIFIFVCVVFIANNSLTYGILLVYTILMIMFSLWIGAGLKFMKRELDRESLFLCVFSYLYWLHRY